MDVDLRFKVAFGVIFGSPCNFPDGDVDCVGKKPKHYKSAEEDYSKRHVRNIDKAVFQGNYLADWLMDKHIPPHFIVNGNRGKYRQGFFGKGAEKSACLIVAGAEHRNVKIFNIFFRRLLPCMDQYLPIIADYLYGSVQIRGNCLELGSHILQRQGAPVIVGSIAGSQQVGFPV